MLRSPSVSSSHGLLPVLHGWQHVSQHVAEVFCLKINAILPVNMKNISTERFSKYDCAVVKMLQKALLWQCFFVCTGWTLTVAWVSKPLLCLQIWPERAIPCGPTCRQVFQVRMQMTRMPVPSYKLLNPWNLWFCLQAVHQKNHWQLLQIPWPSIFGVPEVKTDLAFHHSALSILNGFAFPPSLNRFILYTVTSWVHPLVVIPYTNPFFPTSILHLICVILIPF